jgi:hypothetical protein
MSSTNDAGAHWTVGCASRRQRLRLAIGRLMVLSVTTLGLCGVISCQSNQNPTRLEYCFKYRGEGPSAVCMEKKVLLIPAEFGDIRVGSGDSWHQLEFEYPSMKPWRSLSWFEQRKAQKLTVNLHWIAPATMLDDVFNGRFQAVPDYKKIAPIYDSEQYIGVGWGKRQLLKPFDPKLRVFMECGISDKPVEPVVGNPLQCNVTTTNSWLLKITYTHSQSFLPDWKIVHAKVLATIDSFLVN